LGIWHSVPNILSVEGESEIRFLSIVAMAALLAVTLGATEVSGTWKGAMDFQLGKTDVTLTFQPGVTLAGRVQAGEYEVPMENANLDGNKIHFEIGIQPGWFMTEPWTVTQ